VPGGEDRSGEHRAVSFMGRPPKYETEEAKREAIKADKRRHHAKLKAVDDGEK
jgi:hypothetical protein